MCAVLPSTAPFIASASPPSGNRLDSEVALLREEIRIKDARMAAVAPHRRPHYSPTERMAILELMAARGWPKAEAGRRFLVTDDTVASWSRPD